MAFDKSYPNRKDIRSEYFGSKRFDKSCRNHGSCGYCKSNRTHKNEKRKPIEYSYSNSIIQEYYKMSDV